MKKNIENEINTIRSIIDKKIDEELAIRNKQIEEYKDKIALERSKKERKHLIKALEILNSSNILAENFDRENSNFLALLEQIKSLPSLGSKSTINKAIINAFSKDLHNHNKEYIKEIGYQTIEIIREIKALVEPIYVSYDIQNDPNDLLETINELLTVTIGKLFDLYYEKAMNNEQLSVSHQELENRPEINLDAHESLHKEIETINEYERMYHEKKFGIDTKRKAFSSNQEPSVVIAKAKKAAVDKNYTAVVVNILGSLPIYLLGGSSNNEYYLYDRSIYSNTIRTVNKTIKKYKKIFFDAESTLHNLDFDKIAFQVSNVHKMEEQEESKTSTIQDKEYQTAIEKATILGYQLAEAREKTDKELYAQILEQEKCFNYSIISHDEIVFYENKGFQLFKDEQYACEIFNISKESYETLSDEIRQNIINYAASIDQKGIENIQEASDFIELQKQINTELTPNKPVNPSIRM